MTPLGQSQIAVLHKVARGAAAINVAVARQPRMPVATNVVAAVCVFAVAVVKALNR